MCLLYTQRTSPRSCKTGATTSPIYMRRFNEGDTITAEPWRSAGFPVIQDLMVDRHGLRQDYASWWLRKCTYSCPQDANAILIA